MLNKERLGAFTDAIVAIAATIMVLELHTPAKPNLTSLLREGPTFLAYIVSFVLIYLVWFNHHNIFEKANIISVRTFLYNGIWLFLLTLIPFTTRWVGVAPDRTLPELLYTVDLFLWSLMFQIMDNQIRKDNPNTPTDETNNFGFRFLLYGSYFVSIIMAFIVPLISLLIIALIDVFCLVLIMRRHLRKDNSKR